MRATIVAAIAGVAAAAPNYEPYKAPPAYTSSTPVAYPTTTPVGYAPPAYVSSSSSKSTPVYTPPAGYVSSSTPVGYASSSTPVYTPLPYTTSAPSKPPVYTTKTVYSTTCETVTSCAAYVKNCPASSTITYTKTIPVSTTVCPVTETPIYVKPSKPAYETVIVVKPSHSKPYVPVKESTTCSESVTVTVTIPSKSATPYVPKPVYPTGPAPVYPAPPAGTAPAYVPVGTGSYVQPSAPAQFTGAASSVNAAGFVAGVGAFAALFL
jgi:hypothetical protein